MCYDLWGFVWSQRLAGCVGLGKESQKSALSLNCWLSERDSVCGFVCLSIHPSSISVIFYKFLQVIKLHGALPDGIFSHFPSPPETV